MLVNGQRIGNDAHLVHMDTKVAMSMLASSTSESFPAYPWPASPDWSQGAFLYHPIDMLVNVQSMRKAQHLIHMDTKVAMSMLASSTRPGPCPTRLSTLLASVLAMLCLLRAPAIAKPPSSSMITCTQGLILVQKVGNLAMIACSGHL